MKLCMFWIHVSTPKSLKIKTPHTAKDANLSEKALTRNALVETLESSRDRSELWVCKATMIDTLDIRFSSCALILTRNWNLAVFGALVSEQKFRLIYINTCIFPLQKGQSAS